MSSKKIFFFTILLLISSFLFSQSRYLESGIGGSGFQFNTVIDGNGLSTFGASAAYSIGGIMDIGFSLTRGSGLIENNESTDWGFDFLYNLIAIKQSEYIPLSIQLEGTYGFINKTTVSADPEQSIEGQGFSIGASVFREFNSKGTVSFLVGGKAKYKNFMYNTDREETVLWGALAGVSFKPPQWPIFSIEVEVLFDQMAQGLYIEPAILITTPRF